MAFEAPATPNNTSWTSYHDWLQAQAMALYTDQNYSTSQDMKDQVKWINDQLAAASQNLGVVGTDAEGKPISVQDKMKSLLTEFEQAQADSKSWNEGRYSELTGYAKDASGNVTYNGNTGYNALANQYTTLMTGADGKGGIVGTNGQYWQAVNDASRAGANINAGYDSLVNKSNALVDTLGETQRQGIIDRYAAAKGTQRSSLISRGLGNATVQDSIMTGMDRQQGQEQTKLAEDLSAMKLGYMGQYGQAQLGAAQQNAALLAQLQTQGSQAGQSYADALASMQGRKLQTIENRTDQAPDLSSIANLLMQLGKGSTSQVQLQGFGANSGFTNAGGIGSATNGMFGQ